MLSAALPSRLTDGSAAPQGCTVLDLLGLGLNLAGLRPADPPPVTCVIPTELRDPTPVLAPGALVLTHGKNLTDPASQAEFVARLAHARVSCVGWVVEPPRGSPTVPAALVDAAREAGIAVVAVPAHIRFSEVADLVATRTAAARGATIAEAEQQRLLLESATAGLGLQATIAQVSQTVGQPMRVVGLDGSVIACYPPGSTAGRDGRLGPGGLSPGPEERRSVVVDGVVHAYLVTTAHASAPGLLRFATALAGLELGRLLADAASTRRVLGQVIEDVVDRILSDSEAARRLGRLGVAPDGKHTVLLATAETGQPADLITAVLPLYRCDLADDADGRPPVVGLVNGAVCILAPGECEIGELTGRIYSTLSAHHHGVRIGVGGSLTGIPGLRTSYLEAREGLTRGAGVNPRQALTLSGLLVAQEQTALAELAREVLGPVIESDARSQGDLLTTLRALLDTDFSLARTAEALFVHRNTVKYRISQIERLSGMNLASTADRAQLWVAMSALDGTR